MKSAGAGVSSVVMKPSSFTVLHLQMYTYIYLHIHIYSGIKQKDSSELEYNFHKNDLISL